MREILGRSLVIASLMCSNPSVIFDELDGIVGDDGTIEVASLSLPFNSNPKSTNAS